MNDLTYRFIEERETYEAVAALEEKVWKIDNPLDIISPHTLQVIVHTGGCIIGAFDGDTLVGVVIGFAHHDGRLWSHIAAVLPAYQGRNIGYTLKQEQRQWALAHGYTQMSWTFDPLLSANAHFNVGRLGVQARTYHVNFYGEMTDSLNAGLPSDRLETLWQLDATPTHERDPHAPFLLMCDSDAQPQLQGDPHAPQHRVMIPADFLSIKARDLALAQQWRVALREALQQCFIKDYEIIDFVRQDEGHWYLLQKCG